MNSADSDRDPPRVTTIGAGNMAGALLGGLLQRGHPAQFLRAADPDAETRRRLADELGIETLADNDRAVAEADIVVLAVKPQIIDNVAAGIAESLRPGSVVVSVAAGTPLERLARQLGGHPAIVRVMPNTPALHGAGATGMIASRGCSAVQIRAVREVFEAVGEVFEVDDEALMDVVTAVSGSGPAYFFAFAEALAGAATGAGLDPVMARRLAARTAAGAGAMLADPDADPAELRARVTSPGGTTAAALDSLADGGLDELVERAVHAAVRRGRELGSA